MHDGGGPAGMMPGQQRARGGGHMLDGPDRSERLNALPRRCETELSIQFADGLLVRRRNQ